MDNRTENKMRKQPTKSKPSRRKEKKYKSAKLFRRKSLRSVGHFMSRILKTLGTLAHFGDDAGPPEAEDDDGGFRSSVACSSTLKSTTTSTSGNHNDQVHGLKKSSTVSSHGSVKDRLSLCFGDKTPGVLGLKNHGNTCFMNAVVQCLSNTDLLAEYLGLEQYKSDMCRRSSGSIGVVNGVVKDGDQQTARGEVTVQLASLVRALWTLEYTPQISGDFKVEF